MPRRMSCALTIDSVKTRAKTVTRRHIATWATLKPGDRLTLIEKGMGLPKGASQVVLAEVEIVDVRVESVGLITPEECKREGLGHLSPAEFVAMWLPAHGYTGPTWDGAVLCRRIEWRYLDV